MFLFVLALQEHANSSQNNKIGIFESVEAAMQTVFVKNNNNILVNTKLLITIQYQLFYLICLKEQFWYLEGKTK